MSRFFLLFAISCSLAFVAWAGSVAYDAILIAPGPGAEEISLTVPSGATARTVAGQLQEAGIIESPFAFRAFARLTGAAPRLKAGTFTLKEGMSYVALLSILSLSTAGEEVEITIPEGYTVRQIGEVTRAALPHITKEEWDAATAGLEGYLFPDTYRFHTDATSEDVVGKLRATFGLRLAENGIVQGEDFVKTLTLASILEREVRGAEDMAQVSDIFRKRLEIGMALQADSTVNYATGGNRPSVTYEDLQVDSPYNTYRYPGLPPGPIGNPGIDAIQAAEHPTKNPYYYFLTTPEGEVKYARTFEEHLDNRRRFLR
ncbi:endolytic transglycosylase MltG [Patescibacteria group bacterium]|nr:MAG: endolytic transglycosylase MltG [Patescibacteria group bacterium]